MKYFAIFTIFCCLTLSCSKSGKRGGASHTEIITEKTPVPAEVKYTKDQPSPEIDLDSQLKNSESDLNTESHISFSKASDTDQIQTTIPTGWFRFDRAMTKKQDNQIKDALEHLKKFISSASSYLDQQSDNPLPDAEVVTEKLRLAKQAQAFLTTRPDIDKLIKIKSKLSYSINSFNIVYHGSDKNRSTTVDMELAEEIFNISSIEALKAQVNLKEFLEISRKLIDEEALFNSDFSPYETIGQKISDLIPYAQEAHSVAEVASSNLKLDRDDLADLIDFRMAVINYEDSKKSALSDDSFTEEETAALVKLFNSADALYNLTSVQNILTTNDGLEALDPDFLDNGYLHWYNENYYFINHL